MVREGRYTIEVLALALDVLEHLMIHADEPQRTTDIARALNVERTRIFRILKTLEERGFVLIHSATGRWQLGPKCLEIGERTRDQYDIRRVAEPYIEQLAQRTGEMVELVVLNGDKAVILDGRRGGHRLQVTPAIGQQFPLHVGASPKLLLAFLPEGERERLIQSMKLTPFTLKTITDKTVLRACLAKIRHEGYAIDEGDFETDICSIGAPVRDHRGRVIAGITLSMPATRFTRQRRQEITGMVIETAEQISEWYQRWWHSKPIWRETDGNHAY